MKKTSQVLTEARDYMRKRGWTKDQFENQRGQVCVRGAVNTVCCHEAWSESSVANSAVEILASQIDSNAVSPLCGERCCTSPYNLVAKFNDDPATTYEDIELLWKKAIYEAELEELREEIDADIG